MTETGGAATRMIGTEEIKKHGSTGRLAEHTEAKIVDPDTKEALPPGQRGELWLRGPIIMKGEHAWTQFCHLRLCWDTYQHIYFQMTSFEQLKAAFLVFAAKCGCSLFIKK